MPKTFPPLLAASKIVKTAKRQQVMPESSILEQLDRVDQQLQRLREAMLTESDTTLENGLSAHNGGVELGDRQQERLGQMLFAVAQLATGTGLDAGAALDEVNRLAAQQLGVQNPHGADE